MRQILVLFLAMLVTCTMANATTIVWDGQYLASDTQTTSGAGLRQSVKTKIYYSAKRHAYAGFGGNCTLIGPAVKWFLESKSTVCPVVAQKDSGEVMGYIMILEDGTVLEHFTAEGMVQEIDLTEIATMGTGSPYARTALFFGCDARQAIIVASKFDVNTNNETVYYDVKNHSTELKHYNLKNLQEDSAKTK